MERAQILGWLESHREEVHGEPAEILDQFEEEVRKHAAEDAWLAAKRYVEARMHQWEHHWGFHASEAHVAREICPKLAAELRSHEPHVEAGDEEHLAGAALLRSLEPDARMRVIQWILEIAAEEEHKEWLEIVRFTRRRARGLVREGHVSSDSSWEGTQNYALKAAHVAQLLAQEYEAHVASHD